MGVEATLLYSVINPAALERIKRKSGDKPLKIISHIPFQINHNVAAITEGESLALEL